MHNIGINRTHQFANFLRRKWEEGVEDATKARQRGIPSYGGMFLRPYVGIAPDIPRYNANLKSLLKTAWDIVKPDALAWRCPTAAVVGKGGPKKKDWVIGVILLIKHVK